MDQAHAALAQHLEELVGPESPDGRLAHLLDDSNRLAPPHPGARGALVVPSASWHDLDAERSEMGPGGLGKSFRVGRILGIPISVHWSLLLLAAFLLLLGARHGSWSVE